MSLLDEAKAASAEFDKKAEEIKKQEIEREIIFADHQLISKIRDGQQYEYIVSNSKNDELSPPKFKVTGEKEMLHILEKHFKKEGFTMTNVEIEQGFDYLRSIGLSQYISRADGDIRFSPPDLDYSRWIVRYDADKKTFCIITVVRNSQFYPYDFNTYNAIYAKNCEELEKMTQKALSLINDGQKRQADMQKKAKIKAITTVAERWER